ncbi:MAG: hypothetical protein ACXVGA_05955 [Mycobacteriaceae bacterium]
MRFRTGAVLTATTVGVGLIAAGPSYAASGSNTATPPAPNQSFNAVVTSTIDPTPAATHSTIALTRLGSKVTRPAGELGLRWLLSYIPDGQTDFVTCKASDPNFQKGDDPNTTPIDYTFSEAAGSSFSLNSTGGNPASPYCGNGVYDLYTDGAVFLPDGTPVQVNTLSGPEALVGTTPAPIPLAALKIAVTAAQQNKGNAGKAGQVAAQRNLVTALDAKVSQTAQALAVKTPPKLKPIVLAHR